MSLQKQLMQALNLKDEQFSSHESDLIVLDDDGAVMKWLTKNYEHWKIVTRFKGAGPWAGRSCLDIPFAHEQFWTNRCRVPFH